jgi:hypothetical protein
MRQAPSPHPAMVRSLGVVGILGGLALLAAFVIDIPEAWNPARLILFLAGAIAIAVGAHPPHAHAAPRLAFAGAVPLVVACAWSMTWVVLSIGRERPFGGDFGLIGFYSSLAVWLAHAWFGLCALRIGVLWRPATFVLVLGSLLAITGMDRLQLTTQANPTIFEPLSMLGIALNGAAWVLLGTQLAMGRWQGGAAGVEIPHQGAHA